MQISDYRELTCALLRGKECIWPRAAIDYEFIDFSQSQGILLLLNRSLEQIKKTWPKTIVQAIVIAQAAGRRLEQHRLEATRDLFENLQKNQIKALLFKGASNAYLLYDDHYQRQHADVDILIKVEDYAAVTDVFRKMRFTIDPIEPTKYGPYQTTARFSHSTKPDILIDLHWKINNRLLLADKLNFEELSGRCLQIDQYGQNVNGFGYEDALLAACIHEAGSLPVERDRLIGLHDVHLLIKKLGEQGIQNVSEQAVSKGIGKIYLDYITKAVTTFGEDTQKKMIVDLKSTMQPLADEPSAKLLAYNRSWLDDQRLDLQAIEGLIAKSKYIMVKLLRKLKK